CMQGKQLPWTF
nr:immunoglobulin light chain junction region [Macaca mulatta]